MLLLCHAASGWEAAVHAASQPPPLARPQGTVLHRLGMLELMAWRYVMSANPAAPEPGAAQDWAAGDADDASSLCCDSHPRWATKRAADSSEDEMERPGAKKRMRHIAYIELCVSASANPRKPADAPPVSCPCLQTFAENDQLCSAGL